VSARDPRAATTITVITSLHPVNKRYVLQPDGTLTKTAAATITRGTAQSRIVKTHDEMRALLEEVTNSDNKCIVPGRWHGDDGTPFEIFTKADLASMVGVEEDISLLSLSKRCFISSSMRFATGSSAYGSAGLNSERGLQPELGSLL